MPFTTKQYMDYVWMRLTKGVPQRMSGIMRVAVEASLPAALQRLAEFVAADEGLYPLLMHQWDVTLGVDGTPGQAILIGSVNGLTPTFLLSPPARQRVRVTIEGLDDPSVDVVCRFLPNFSDLLNPPPIPDQKYYYTFWMRSLVVRDSEGAVPAQTAVKLYGMKVPLSTDEAFDGTNELFDNLIDIGCKIVTETSDAPEAARQAETGT